MSQLDPTTPQITFPDKMEVYNDELTPLYTVGTISTAPDNPIHTKVEEIVTTPDNPIHTKVEEIVTTPDNPIHTKIANEKDDFIDVDAFIATRIEKPLHVKKFRNREEFIIEVAMRMYCNQSFQMGQVNAEELAKICIKNAIIFCDTLYNAKFEI